MALQRSFTGGMGGHPHVAKRCALRDTRRAYSITQTTTAGNMPLRARCVLVRHFAIVDLVGSVKPLRALMTTTAPAPRDCSRSRGKTRAGRGPACGEGSRTCRVPYSLINRNNLGNPHAYWVCGLQLVFERSDKCT